MPEEQAFLVGAERRRNPSTGKWYWPGQRVELNAMTSDQFVDWIEQRLTEQGVEKVIPDQDTLAQAYRRAVRTNDVNAALVRLQATMRQQPIAIPANLHARVGDVLRESPELSWDAAVWKIVQETDGDTHNASK